MSQPTVIVMGGSLGGLTAALFLRQVGCQVTVYERAATTLTGQGAGIVLNPATVRYFAQQGTLDLDAISVASRWVRYLDAAGETVAENPFAYRFTSYNALYRGLLAAWGAEDYHLGAPITDFDQDQHGVSVEIHKQSTVRCDLLVCADGIRSTARAHLLPNSQLAYAGYVAWRGLVRADQIAAPLYARLRDAITYHIMPHSHMLTYPIPQVDRAPNAAPPSINWLWYRNVAPGAALQTLMTDRIGALRDVSVPPGAVPDEQIRRLRQEASRELPPPLAGLIAETEQPFLQAIMDCAVPQMAFGRVALIGDAAFVARPHAAAGSAKAAEDGWQLRQALQAAQGDVTAALAAWEPRQLALGQAVLERTRAAGQRSQVSNTWRVGDPLPFGLYRVGDSRMI